MLKYIIKRILLLIPTLLVVLALVFILLRLVPGGPAKALLQAEFGADREFTQEEIDAKEHELGLDRPLLVQFADYVSGIFTGDWGTSYYNDKDVFVNMKAVWEPTLLMNVYAFIVTVVLALPLGIFAATHRGSVFDLSITSLSTVIMCIPAVSFALFVSYVFGYKLSWFPCVGYTKLAAHDFKKTLWTLTLPAVSLGIRHVAGLARYTRSSFLDVLNQDYIRTARAKGLSMQKIYYKHAMKNTMPIVGTMLIRSIAGMLGGAVVIENVFNINGMGKLGVASISRRDYGQEQAICVFFAMVTLVTDLILDIMYKLLDPRIDYN